MASRHSQVEDISDAKKAVHTFGRQAFSGEPNNDLAESLVVAEATDKRDKKKEATLREQWVDLFDPATNSAFNGSQEENMLANSTDELAKAYKTFLKCLPKGHEARIEDGSPKLEVVINAVAMADTKWKDNREKTKAGRMKTLFGKVAGSLNKHRDMFAIIPSGDKYVCLLTGSVSAIVKVRQPHL